MIIVELKKDISNGFAENKDLASRIRKEKLMPALKKNEEVILDFGGIEAATQSFIHALISDLFRHYGAATLDNISFKNCNENIKKIINIVVDYMQQAE